MFIPSSHQRTGDLVAGFTPHGAPKAAYRDDGSALVLECPRCFESWWIHISAELVINIAPHCKDWPERKREISVHPEEGP